MYTPEQIRCMSIDEAKKEINLIYEMELCDPREHINGLTDEERQVIKLYESCLQHRIIDLKKKLPYRIKETCMNFYYRLLNC